MNNKDSDNHLITFLFLSYSKGVLTAGLQRSRRTWENVISGHVKAGQAGTSATELRHEQLATHLLSLFPHPMTHPTYGIAPSIATRHKSAAHGSDVIVEPKTFVCVFFKCRGSGIFFKDRLDSTAGWRETQLRLTFSVQCIKVDTRVQTARALITLREPCFDKKQLQHIK